MAKVNKTINSNIDPGTIAISGTWGNYVNSESICHFPDKDAWRQRLCFTMMKWVNGEDGDEHIERLEIMQFCKKYRIAYHTLLNWVHAYPDVAAHYNEMKLILASNRRVGCMTRKLDRESCFKDLHRYDPEWVQVDKYHADLKVDNEDKSHVFNITITKPEITTPEELKLEVDKTKE